MPNYLCTVNEMGPANYGATTNPNVYVNLTDTLGSFTNTWFYADEGIQEQVLDTCIAAIIHNKRVDVTASAPAAAGGPYTAIVRMAVSRPIPPAAPSGLHVSEPISSASQGRSVIQFAWNDNSGGEATFDLSYLGRLAGYPDDTQGVQKLKALTYSFLVFDGYEYTATVSAVNAAGESPGDTIVGTIPGKPPIPAAPGGITAAVSPKDANDSTITVRWSDNSNNESGFIVSFTAIAGAGVTLPEAHLPANTSTYSFTVANNGTTYSVNVQAYNPSGSSVAETPATFTVPPPNVTSAASISAHVNPSPTQVNTWELDISGFNFQNAEIVQVVITWWASNDSNPGVYVEESQPVVGGGFRLAFSGVNNPLTDSQQRFQVQATGLTSNKKASTTV